MKAPILIFDFDGTLLDSKGAFYDAFRNFYQKEKGIALSMEQFLELGKGNIWERFHASGFTEDHRTAFIRDEFPAAFDGSHLFDGIDDVIRSLKKDLGADLHILTSNEHAMVSRKLNDYLLLDYFTTVTGRSHLSKTEILRENFPDPAGCWHIGDTVGDMIAGKDAGMKTVAVTWGFHDEEMLSAANPDHLIRNQRDLLSVFGA